MKVLVIIATVVAVVSCSALPAAQYDVAKYEAIEKQAEAFADEDAKLLVPEIIKKYGYPSEVHTVVSKDGYILEMHRIAYDSKKPGYKGCVYLQHGVLASSADWILAGPGKGMAYILYDAGYDVWMPNVRGTRYSRKHISLDPDKNAKQFWDFSWHEIAVDDVPAMVDYVADYTKEKLFYIGHSQGTCVFYIMCAEMPEYNDKFIAMFSLAPIGYMKSMTSPLMRLIAIADWGMGVIFELIGMHEFLPHSTFLSNIGNVLCGDNSIFQILCTNSLFAVCGFNHKQMNATLLPRIMGHTPAGSSTKQFLHFAQEVNSGKFRKWDYGLVGNMKHYGSMSPPSYKLKNVKTPVYLLYSRNDWLSNEKDVRRLFDQLGNVQGKFLSPDNKFNHVDYVYGIEAPDILYNRVLSLMKRH